MSRQERFGRVRKGRKRRISIQKRGLLLFFVILAIIGATFLTDSYLDKKAMDDIRNGKVPNWVDQQLIEEGTSARPSLAIEEINGIVIHYVANPGSTAEQNRNYFNRPGTKVSSHFIIGLDGEIIQCVPLFEQAVASNFRNTDTISIEMCHPDESGKFNAASMTSLIKLTNWITDTCRLKRSDVIRHYDITGKSCPKYFVDNEGEWENFLKQIK